MAWNDPSTEESENTLKTQLKVTEEKIIIAETNVETGVNEIDEELRRNFGRVQKLRATEEKIKKREVGEKRSQKK